MANREEVLRLSFEVAISLLLVFVVVAWSIQILLPFISLIAWGAVIAISLHHPFCGLRDRIGGRWAAIVFGVLGVATILVPAVLFADSLITSVMSFARSVETSEFHIATPNESVKDWPLVGARLFEAWSAAATDFEDFLREFAPQLKQLATFAAGKVAGLGITVLLFLASTVIAVALLANDKVVEKGLLRLFARLTGEANAREQMGLATATVRSVTMGVLGVAFIQALLGGLGMVLAGVPGAGLWAIAILVLAVAQLPPLLVLLPAIIYVFAHESTVVASVFAVWSLIVAFGDAFLKPLLLGRGVNVPTLVILLGAIGGMLMSGILGLFVGAVVLALGYQLMLQWLAMDDPKDTPASGDETRPEEG
ncbi:MAG: AI-2E family transporter [Xanthomonadales bacterium]|jgi:predicted PurR-regulated permease PerM|nr:AI-2E family transporter [Xanthomonadales bacterium]